MTGRNKNDRTSKWPTTAETKAPAKTRSDPEGRLSSDVPSNCADNDAGVDLHSWKQHSADAEEHQLADWTGGFAPALVDWEGRPGFNSSRYLDRITRWKSSLVESCNHIRSDDLLKFEGSEFVPRAWVPDTIDDIPVSVWWSKLLKDPIVERSAKPFWERYTTHDSILLVPWQAPDVKLDSEEHNSALLKKAKVQTTSSACEQLANRRLAFYNDFKNKRAHDKAVRRLERLHTPGANPNAPKANIYVRPAEERDILQMREIYNSEIEHAITCPEVDRIGMEEMKSRWADVKANRLPYLVAVERSVKPNKVQRYVAKNEYVVGFASAEDYNDRLGMYRFTVEVEVYVRKLHRRMGIGKCLMDRLLSLLDSTHLLLGGCEFIGDVADAIAGGQRDVYGIIVHLPYSKEEIKERDWRKVWLEQYGFVQRGDYPGIGRKLGRIVDLAVLQKDTGIAPHI